MIETITIVTLTLVALAILRPGKPEPLAKVMTINRIGQFHALLAPMINLAQPLLEDISDHLGNQDRITGNTEPCYFVVRDKEVSAHGAPYYLLAATLIDGVLYFQAIAPKEGEGNLATICAFANTELTRHPSSQPLSEVAEAALMRAIHLATKKRGVSFAQLGVSMA